ncbi:MAG TPA: hypothetical protein VLE99_06625, partial [Candidatus Saccharimonadales bacterium]|nr:hypothetical protein [Candidatus Saccharimonadales bacterium]
TSNNIVGMSYSEDPDTPAFDPNVLSVAQNGQLSGLLQGAKLTDVNGTALPDDAATAIKTTGAYELYAAHATRLKDDSGPMPDCPVQLMDLKIDVATGMFADVTVYNGQVAPDKLAFELKQQIVTDTGNFATEEPKLVAEGFNLERAKAFAQSAVTNVANEPAGFEFWYRKAALGKATVSGDSDGVISYSFAKYPQVTFRVYTAQATGQEPKNLASLKATATASGWQILSDDVQHGIKYPGYSAADTELFTATDGTKDYAMFATGTPDAPYAYVELPVGLGDRTDPATGEQPSLSYVESQALSVANIFVFTPGSTVPVGAG